MVGRAGEPGLEPLDRGQGGWTAQGRRAAADGPEALELRVDPAPAAAARVDGEPVLVESARAQSPDALGDPDALAVPGAREVALARDALPVVPAGAAQLDPDRPCGGRGDGAVATVLARLLEGAAMDLRLERGGVGGYVGGPLDLEAAPVAAAAKRTARAATETFGMQLLSGGRRQRTKSGRGLAARRLASQGRGVRALRREATWPHLTRLAACFLAAVVCLAVRGVQAPRPSSRCEGNHLVDTRSGLAVRAARRELAELRVRLQRRLRLLQLGERAERRAGRGRRGADRELAHQHGAGAAEPGLLARRGRAAPVREGVGLPRRGAQVGRRRCTRPTWPWCSTCTGRGRRAWSPTASARCPTTARTTSGARSRGRSRRTAR